MSDTFWVRSGAKVYGPFSSGHLRQLASIGKLKPEHQLSKDQLNWTAAGRVKGLHFSTVVRHSPGETQQSERSEAKSPQFGSQSRTLPPIGMKSESVDDPPKSHAAPAPGGNVPPPSSTTAVDRATEEWKTLDYESLQEINLLLAFDYEDRAMARYAATCECDRERARLAIRAIEAQAPVFVRCRCGKTLKARPEDRKVLATSGTSCPCCAKIIKLERCDVRDRPSAPVTEARPAVGCQYSTAATDAHRELPTFHLDVAPRGMTVDTSSAFATATPASKSDGDDEAEIGERLQILKLAGVGAFGGLFTGALLLAALYMLAGMGPEAIANSPPQPGARKLIVLALMELLGAVGIPGWLLIWCGVGTVMAVIQGIRDQ